MHTKTKITSIEEANAFLDAHFAYSKQKFRVEQRNGVYRLICGEVTEYFSNTNLITVLCYAHPGARHYLI